MDIILYNIFVPIICIIFGYLCGSFSFSIFIGKVFFHQDPRNYGSKNAGGTNAGRLWGKKFGLLVITLDMLKTILPMWICWAILTFVPFGDKPLIATTAVYYTAENANYIIQWPVYYLAAFGCLIGHCWPIFYKFKGGKGASAYMGTTLGSTWGLGFLPAGIFYFPILKKTKMVSLTMIIYSAIQLLVMWLWVILVMTHVVPDGWQWFVMYGPSLNPTWHYALIITVMVIIMDARHHANIGRILRHEERKITWMGK